MNTTPPPIPSTLPQLKRQRADAALRAHQVLTAFMLGVQMFLYGTGSAPRLSGHAMYLCALTAPVCAGTLGLLLHALRRRHDMRPLPAIYRAVWGRFLGGAACVLTGALFMMDLWGDFAMLGSLGSARLLPIHEGSATYLPALLALFLATALAGSGLERLAFLSRRIVPAILLILSFLLVRRDPISNLFPLLGRSLPDTARGALYATGAASCALALGFAPAALSGDEIPTRRSGVRAVLVGGLCASGLLLSVSLSMPASALTSSAQWPELLIHTGTYTENIGVFYLLVVLLECFALLIAMGGALRFAVDAFAGAMPLRFARTLAYTLTLCAAAAVWLGGTELVLSLLPVRFVPALALVLLTLCRDLLRARRRAAA